MRPSPLVLREYFTTDFRFSAQPNYQGDDRHTGAINPADLKVEVIEGQQEDNHLIRNCQLSLELEDPTGGKFPYTFSITLLGFFEVVDWWDPDKVDSLVSANAPALLYSAARETIALLTGRGPFSRILLPSVTFVKVPAQSTEGQSKQLPPAQTKLKGNGKRPRRKVL